jgi:hypothetical protein
MMSVIGMFHQLSLTRLWMRPGVSLLADGYLNHDRRYDLRPCSACILHSAVSCPLLQPAHDIRLRKRLAVFVDIGATIA